MEFIENYNLIDLFIIGTLSTTLVLGIWKGFVRSLTALASLVFGVILAVKYYPRIEPYLAKVSSLDPHISMILSMILVFIAVQAVFVVIRYVLDMLIDVSRLSWLDRTLGAAMGVSAGFLLASAAVHAILMGVPEWSVVKESKLVEPMRELSSKAVAYAPKHYVEQVETLINKWKGTKEAPPSPPVPRRNLSRNMSSSAPSGPVE